MKDVSVSSKNMKKTKKDKFVKTLAIVLAMIVLFAVSFAVTYHIVGYNTYNKLSTLGDFDANEFIDMNIPKKYEFRSLTENDKYSNNSNIVLFSDDKTDLLFNITANTELHTVEEVATNLANGLKTQLKLSEVYTSSITTSNNLTIPIITFQYGTPEGIRFFHYAVINSGYQTILISMNSLTNNFKMFSKIIGSVELI